MRNITTGRKPVPADDIRWAIRIFLTRFVSARKCLIWQGKNDGAENEKKLDFTHLGVREKETGAHFRKQKRFEDIDLVAITGKKTCLWGVWHAKKSIHIFFAKWYIHTGT